MYDINISNVKKGKKGFFIFILVGMLFMGVMGSIYVSSIIKLKSLDATTMSTSVEVNSHVNDEGTTLYSPVYYYRVNGDTYSCRSNVSTSSYPGTDNKLVYYDSNNPEKCMSEFSKSSNKLLLIFMIIPIISILVGVLNIKKINKRIQAIQELNQRGKLVKNLPYRLEDTGTIINNVPIQRPVVDYTLSSGSTITLYGDPRNDRKTSDADGMVDLIIDESNPENYFIDFEINRLTGNLDSDYYKPKTTEQNINPQPMNYQQPVQQNINPQPMNYQQPFQQNINPQPNEYNQNNNF